MTLYLDGSASAAAPAAAAVGGDPGDGGPGRRTDGCVALPGGEPDPGWSRSLYVDLRRLASSLAPAGGRDDSIRPTVLVHEAFLRMARSGAAAGPGACVERRRRFFALARLAMRSYLVDRGRRRRTRRAFTSALGEWALAAQAGPQERAPEGQDLLGALTRLSAIDPRKGRVVELRFLAGLSVADTARALDVSERTVELDWRGARAWLNRELKTPGGPTATAPATATTCTTHRMTGS